MPLKSYFFRRKGIEKVLVSNKFSPSEKNYKYLIFFFFLHNDHEVKELYVMLPKTSTYVKSYDGHTKWMYFFIDDDLLLFENQTKILW